MTTIYVQHVRHGDIALFESRGWVLAADQAGTHHGTYGVLMQAPEGFVPPEPHRAGQHHLADGWARELPQSMPRATETRRACAHEWASGPSSSIICEHCGTPWDKNQPGYVDHIVLVRR